MTFVATLRQLTPPVITGLPPPSPPRPPDPPHPASGLKMDKKFWKKHLRRGLIIFTAVKLVMGLQNVIYRKPVFGATRQAFALDSFYDRGSESFRLIDRKNVTFHLRPSLECPADGGVVVVMALSAPRNTMKREQLRREVKKSVPGAVLIFLLGKTRSLEDQINLENEHLSHGDILQTTVIDAYYNLAYKTLSGFIWTNRYCSTARYIIKMDDDVKSDLRHLLNKMAIKYKGILPPILECPSVMRNMRPWRHNHTNTIMGKWSVSREEMPRRVHPDFCPGWLYVTTPRVGLALAQTGVDTAHELMAVSKLDDIFVTGFLRERLPWVQLQQFDSGISGTVWNRFLSQCPFLGITKNIFANDVVLDKGSGSVTYIKGMKFYSCAFLEFFILENMELMMPDMVPPYLWDLCAR